MVACFPGPSLSLLFVDLPKNQEGGCSPSFQSPPRSSKVLLGPPRSSCSWVREGIGLVPPGPPRPPPPSGAPGLPSHGTAGCRRPGPGASIHKNCGHHTDSPPPPQTTPVPPIPISSHSDFCKIKFLALLGFCKCEIFDRGISDRFHLFQHTISSITWSLILQHPVKYNRE